MRRVIADNAEPARTPPPPLQSPHSTSGVDALFPRPAPADSRRERPTRSAMARARRLVRFGGLGRIGCQTAVNSRLPQLQNPHPVHLRAQLPWLRSAPSLTGGKSSEPASVRKTSHRRPSPTHRSISALALASNVSTRAPSSSYRAGVFPAGGFEAGALALLSPSWSARLLSDPETSTRLRKRRLRSRESRPETFGPIRALVRLKWKRLSFVALLPPFAQKHAVI